jgi:hypothetical protein
MKRLGRWLSAYVWDYPYWRVTYQDGKKTRLLYYLEAKSLADVWNGKLWIDYDVQNITNKGR